MTNKLTNADIVARLLEIRKMDNACDRVETLKAFEKEYKKSPFYHKTHKNLTLLYYEVSIENILTFQSLLKNAQEFINNLDLDHFTELMDQVNLQTKFTIDDGIEAINTSGLADLLKGTKA